MIVVVMNFILWIMAIYKPPWISLWLLSGLCVVPGMPLKEERQVSEGAREFTCSQICKLSWDQTSTSFKACEQGCKAWDSLQPGPVASMMVACYGICENIYHSLKRTTGERLCKVGCDKARSIRGIPKVSSAFDNPAAMKTCRGEVKQDCLMSEEAATLDAANKLAAAKSHCWKRKVELDGLMNEETATLKDLEINDGSTGGIQTGDETDARMLMNGTMGIGGYVGRGSIERGIIMSLKENKKKGYPVNRYRGKDQHSQVRNDGPFSKAKKGIKMLTPTLDPQDAVTKKKSKKWKKGVVESVHEEDL